MRPYIFLLLTMLFFGTIACDNEDTTDPALISELDKQFILTSADDALFQVNAGQVAASATTKKEIQTFGEEMTTEHTQVGQELQKLAAARKVELPTTLSDDRQQQLDSLSMQKGEKLDTLYLNQMATAHSRIVRLLEIEGTTGKDQELKQWASERLPKARQLDERAKAMRDSLD